MKKHFSNITTSRFPAIFFVLFFIVGILLGSYISVPFRYVFASLLIVVSFIFVFRKHTNVIFLFLPVFLIIIAGIIRVIAYQQSTSEREIPFETRDEVLVSGRISEIDLIRQGKIRLIIDANTITDSDIVYRVHTMLLCTIDDEPSDNAKSLYQQIQPGNGITCYGRVSKPSGMRNPGGFDFEKYMRSNGLSGLLWVASPDLVHITDSTESMISSLLFSVRMAIDNQLASVCSAEMHSLLRGLLLGDRSMIDEDMKNDFKNAGVFHVLAVSGLHTGFIVLILFVLLQRIHIKWRIVISIIGLFLFVFLTGAAPPVVRASLMVTVYFLSILLNRHTSRYNAIAIAALVLLVINPNELFQPGFQLSFVAALSIIFALDLLEKWKWLYGQTKPLRTSVSFIFVTLAAQFSTFPLIIYYFGSISLIGIIVNLAVVPLVFIFVANSIVMLALSTIGLGAIFVNASEALFTLISVLIEEASSASFSHILVSSVSSAMVLLFYALLVVGVLLVKYIKSTMYRIISVSALLPLLFIGWAILSHPIMPDGKLSIIMLDVGQGDAFFIGTPEGKIILFDAGPRMLNQDAGRYTIMPFMNYAGIKKIDMGIISHYDIDHIGGYLHLLAKNKIIHLYKPPFHPELEEEIAFHRYVHYFQTDYTTIVDTTMHVDDVTLRFLKTIEKDTYPILSGNNRSLVLKVEYKNTSVLLTGDINEKLEQELIRMNGNELQADILKAGHHGSKYSTSEELLDIVHPKICLISTSKNNPYGHPSEELLSRLFDRNIEVYRTDSCGAVLLQSNGEEWNIVDWKE